MIPEDTIVAPATPFGFGGLSVIRISGPDSISVISSLSSVKNLNHRQATLLSLTSPSSGQYLDNCICTFFNAPNSYTGEDVIEISCHGNPLIVQKILEECCLAGARIAEPGEYTKRAFLNGKLDLIQAEAITSLIQAKSFESIQLSQSHLKGALSKRLTGFKKRLISLIGQIEFELDISEEDLQPGLPDIVRHQTGALIAINQGLLKSYHQGKLITDGAMVVIAGDSNVGKSTLLNYLTESDRAITSDIPGTTRDPIDKAIVLDGVPIRLVDTAGLRKTKDQIEAEGIKRTQTYLKDADLVLYLCDQKKYDYSHPLKIDCPVLKIQNKCDLDYLSNDAIGYDFSISAKTGKGIDNLKKAIIHTLGFSFSLELDSVLTTVRQFDILSICHSQLIKAQNLLSLNTLPEYELISFEFRLALDALDRLLGKTTPDDILNTVFNNFCVGK